MIAERIQLSSDGQAFTSTIRYDSFDLRGAPVEGGGTARRQALRIR
jgi:hypothetical protein